MNTVSLKGLSILNTRPNYQNAHHHLSERLKEHGAQVVSLPLQEIIPIPYKQWLSELENLASLDFIIFVSVPAVHCFFQGLIKAKKKLPPAIKVIAMGSATASHLQAYHQSNVVFSQGANSEALINEFNHEVKHKNVMIVKGPHGRTFISEQLQLRKAKVQELNVYESHDVIYSRKFLTELWKSRPIHIILITSVKSLLSLYQQLPKQFHASFAKIQLLVLSERIKLEAEKLLKNPIIVCKHDEILQALLTFNSVKT